MSTNTNMSEEIAYKQNHKLNDNESVKQTEKENSLLGKDNFYTKTFLRRKDKRDSFLFRSEVRIVIHEKGEFKK